MSNLNEIENNIIPTQISPELKRNYFEAYYDYIQSMGKYCNKLDNVISNQDCNDFVTNNKFLHFTKLTAGLELQRTKACLSNTNTTLNSICEKLNTIPIVNTSYNKTSDVHVSSYNLNTSEISIYCSSDDNDGYIYLPILKPSSNGLFNLKNNRMLSVTPKGNLIVSDTTQPLIWQSFTKSTNDNNINYSLYLNKNGNLILKDPLDDKNSIIAVELPPNTNTAPPFYFGCDKSLNMFILDSNGTYLWNSTAFDEKTKASINTDSNGVSIIINLNKDSINLHPSLVTKNNFTQTIVLNNRFYKNMGLLKSRSDIDVICEFPLMGTRGGFLDLNRDGNLVTYNIQGAIAWVSKTANIGIGPFKLLFSPNGSLKLIDSNKLVLMSVPLNNTFTTGPYGLYVDETGKINIISLSGVLCNGLVCPTVWTSDMYASFNIYPDIISPTVIPPPVISPPVISPPAILTPEITTTMAPSTTVTANTIVDTAVYPNLPALPITTTTITNEMPAANTQDTNLNLDNKDKIIKTDTEIKTDNITKTDTPVEKTIFEEYQTLIIFLIVLFALCIVLGGAFIWYRNKKQSQLLLATK